MFANNLFATSDSPAARAGRKPAFTGKFVAAAMITGLVLFAPAVAQAPGLGALENAKKGLWEVRFRDGTATKRICVQNGRELIQINHRGHACGRHSVETEGDEVTVQYTCRGEGFGRTNLRVETANLIQIDSHGVANDLPFHFSAEARYVGACS